MEVKKILIYLVISIIIFTVISNYMLKLNLFKNQKLLGLNVILLLLIFLTVLSFGALGISYKAIPNLNNIDVLPGNDGEVGERGDKGEPANPLAECNDDICFRKIMDHITNVVNLWCKVRGIAPYSEGTYIKNKYLQ